MFKETLLYWVSGLICIFLMSIVLSITTYYRHQDNVIAKMVADGEDPIAALCAMTDTYGTHPLCLIIASDK